MNYCHQKLIITNALYIVYIKIVTEIIFEYKLKTFFKVRYVLSKFQTFKNFYVSKEFDLEKLSLT